MNASEQPFKPLPIDDDTVFKLSEETDIGVSGGAVLISRPIPFVSTKEFIDKLIKNFIALLYPRQIFNEGMKAKVIEPGKKWVSGTIRLRLVFEFIPDELEKDGTLDRVTSSLDDFRSKNL